MVREIPFCCYRRQRRLYAERISLCIGFSYEIACPNTAQHDCRCDNACKRKECRFAETEIGKPAFGNLFCRESSATDQHQTVIAIYHLRDAAREYEGEKCPEEQAHRSIGYYNETSVEPMASLPRMRQADTVIVGRRQNHLNHYAQETPCNPPLWHIKQER